MPHSSDAIEVRFRVPALPDENGLAWHRFLQRVSFRFTPLGIFFAIEQRWAAGGVRDLYMAMNVPDVRGKAGEPVHISRYQMLPLFPGDQLAALQLRAWAAELLLHELDEQFQVDGIRVFDPHDPARAIR